MSQEIDTLMPHDLINAKPVSAVVKEYFGSSQLSQFMDQTNPLSEVTHKRRLSALGPGGDPRARGSRWRRARTHYAASARSRRPRGRTSDSCVALDVRARQRVRLRREPYRKVETRTGDRGGDLVSALEEEGKKSPRPGQLDEKGNFKDSLVSVAINGEFGSRRDGRVMDVAPNQMVAGRRRALPFLEQRRRHRALMGANCRPAVPDAHPRELVGTGMEERLARD